MNAIIINAQRTYKHDEWVANFDKSRWEAKNPKEIISGNVNIWIVAMKGLEIGPR